MHSSRYTHYFLIPALTAFAACGGPADDGHNPAVFGSAEIRLTAAPADVYCLRVQATGSRFVEKAVDVVPGQSTVFTMTGLPVGSVTFNGDAFNQSCSMIAGATPTWVADPVATSIQSSSVAQVNLTMKRNGQANVSVDFQEDPTTSCVDGVQNGTETGIDCGGSVCPPCSIGNSCMVASDCVAPSICQNGVCVSSAACMSDADCLMGTVCVGGMCVNSSCTDGVKDGTETGVDCGGGSCGPCPIGASCIVATDCVSPSICQAGVCVASSACMTNADCPPGTVCNGGVCGGTPSCMTDAECPAGYSCQNGVCSITCHPVINEVQVDGPGGTGDEFIELYNPCMLPWDLTNFKVLYRSAGGVTDVPIANLSGFIMGPSSFFVLASSGYTGPGPIEFVFPANQLSSNGGGLGLYNNNGVLVDSVGYGAVMNIYVEGSPAPAPFPGQSISRMPNGVDTNNNAVDFMVTPPTPHLFN